MRKIVKNKRKKIYNFILTTSLAVTMAMSILTPSITAKATTIKDIQTQIDAHEDELEEVNDQISALTDEQDLIQEMIDDLNAEIINTMASIGMKEDEIAAKEADLADKQVELDNKQVEINETQKAYEEAKAREEKQYADMQVWIKCMYENSNTSYLVMFLKGDGLADLLNHMDYIEKVYEYGMDKLAEYEATKNQVHDLWDQLELEKAQLETEKAQLAADKAQLETDREALQGQKQELDTMLAQKKEESANFEAEIKRYQQEAAVMQKLLEQERQQLQDMQSQSNASNGTYSDTGYSSIIDNANGSDLGKRVAKYACQYIGNPYVYGGTSLTSGADCSGFVYRVYKDFGYNLPRTSYEQRSVGTGVNYSDAQPGDLICYSGHIGIYIGDGKIVHASNSNPYPRGGIKVSNATYRSILAVRRVVK